MKNCFLVFSILLMACSENINISKPIDLNNIDSVKINIAGKWHLNESELEKEVLIIHSNSTDPSDSSISWDILNSKTIQELNKTGKYSISLPSCQAFTSLSINKGSTYIKSVGMGGTKKHFISYLSKDKLILNQKEYVKK